jgi:hypothetical protein
MTFVILIVGGFSTLLGVWLLLLGEFNPSMLGGLILLFIGYQYLRRPYFVVEPDQVVMLAPFGSFQRNFNVDEPQHVKIEDHKLLVFRRDHWIRVPVYYFMSSQNDWKAMESKLSDAGAQ